MTTLPPPPDAKHLLTHHTRCDRCDYLVATACGAIASMVDIFLTSLPKNSRPFALSDSTVDRIVIRFAELSGWKPNSLQKDNISSAISYLEKSYSINYDQRHSSGVPGLMKILEHSPSPIGLFFSVLSQLTSTSSSLSQGEMVMIPAQDFGLRGDSLIERIFFGVVNWFEHLMSDTASSFEKHEMRDDKNHGCRTGIVLPFYKLLSLCKLSRFQISNARQDLAAIAVCSFQEGNDLHFGMTPFVPALLADLLTRFFWAFRRYFEFGEKLKDCIPTKKQDDLRTMLIVSNAALCTEDILDAAFRSGGSFLTFFPRLNLPAWFLFVRRIFKEVCFHIGMGERELTAYEELNNALEDALRELKPMETNFREVTRPYLSAAEKLSAASSPDELNHILFEMTSQLKLELPWEENFDKYTSNKDGILRFK